MATTKRLRECKQGDFVVMGTGQRPRLLWQVVRMGGRDVRLLAANETALKSKACSPNGFKKNISTGPGALSNDTVTVLGNVSELGQSVLDLYKEDKDTVDKNGG